MNPFLSIVKTRKKTDIHDSTRLQNKKIQRLQKQQLKQAYNSHKMKLYIQSKTTKSDPNPAFYNGDKYILFLNGDMYNTHMLKQQLKNDGHKIKTTHIGELLTTYIDLYGLQAIRFFHGKFALLLYNKKKQQIIVARDAFGIKPIYYIKYKDQIIIASDKKLLLPFIEETKIHKQALQLYFSFQYVPEPLTMSPQIKMVKPGHYIFENDRQEIDYKQYFHATLKPISMNKDQRIKQIQEAMFTAIESQVKKTSNSSIGVFLSSGIDSTIIATIAKEVHPQVKTFTIGFEQKGYSENDIAEKTANSIQTEHHFKQLTPAQFVEDLYQIVAFLEDPLADPSAIPLYYVSKKAKKHVHTILSGEGADEIFGGYRKYRETIPLQVFQFLPNSLRKLLQAFAYSLQDGIKGKSFLLRGTTPIEQRYIGNRKIFEEHEKGKFLTSYNSQYRYEKWMEPIYNQARTLHTAERMQYVDLQTWLPGNILYKADYLTKNTHLHIHFPFLHNKVYNVAKRITMREKLAHRTTKAILREAFQDFIPHHVIHQKNWAILFPYAFGYKLAYFYGRNKKSNKVIFATFWTNNTFYSY